MSRKLNRNVRLGVECLEDRNLATAGLNPTAGLVPMQISQPAYSTVQTTSPMVIPAMDGSHDIFSHLDYQSGLRTNHNETLVRDVRKRRSRSNVRA